jgi:hypothetical protein
VGPKFLQAPGTLPGSTSLASFPTTSLSLETHEIIQPSSSAPSKHKNWQGDGDKHILMCIWNEAQLGPNLLQAREPLLSSTSLASIPTCTRLKPTKSSNCPSLPLANQQESRGVITHPFSHAFRTNCKWVQTSSRHPVTFPAQLLSPASRLAAWNQQKGQTVPHCTNQSNMRVRGCSPVHSYVELEQNTSGSKLVPGTRSPSQLNFFPQHPDLLLGTNETVKLSLTAPASQTGE